MENDNILYLISGEIKTTIDVGNINMVRAWNVLSFVLPDLYSNLGLSYTDCCVTQNDYSVINLQKKKMSLVLVEEENCYKLKGSGLADNWDCIVSADAIELSENVISVRIDTSTNQKNNPRIMRRYNDFKWIKEYLKGEGGVLLHKIDCKKREVVDSFLVEEDNVEQFNYEDIKKRKLNVPTVKF